MSINSRLSVTVTVLVILLFSLGASAENPNDAQKLYDEGSLLLKESKYDETLEKWQNGLEISEKLNDKKMQSLFLNGFGAVNFYQGKFDKALEYFEKSLQMRHETGDKKNEAASLNNIGSVYTYLGKHDKALEYYEKSLQIMREIGDKKGESTSLNNIGHIYYGTGKYDKALEYFEKALSLVEGGDDKSYEKLLLFNIGASLGQTGNLEKALEFHGKSLSIAEELGDKAGIATSLNDIGSIHNRLGKYEKALECHEKALKMRQELGDKKGEGTSFNNIGSVYINLREYGKALEYYEKSLKIAQELGDRQGEGLALRNIATVHKDSGKYDTAMEYHEKSLKIARECGDKKGEAECLNNICLIYAILGANYEKLGEHQKALLNFEESLKIMQQTGDKRGEAVALNLIGSVYLNLCKYDEALGYYQKSMRIMQQTGDKKSEAVAIITIASINGRLGEYEKALMNLDKSLKILQQIGDKQSEGLILNSIGSIYLNLEDYELAIGYFEKAMKIAQEIGDKNSEWISLDHLGVSYDSIGESEKALLYYEKSLQITKEIGDKKSEAEVLNRFINNRAFIRKKTEEYKKKYNDAKEADQRLFKDAVDWYTKLLKKHRELGNKGGEGEALLRSGAIYIYVGCVNNNSDILNNAVESIESSLKIFEEINDAWGKFESLRYLGMAYDFLNEDDKALDYYLKAVTLLESIQSKLISEKYKSTSMREGVKVYERIIQLLLRKGKTEDAWRYAEMAKGRAFLYRLGSSRIKFRAKGDPELMRKEEEIDKEITTTRALLEQEEKGDRQRELYRRIEALQKDYGETFDKLRRSNPEYASLKSVEVAGLKDIQGSLAEDCIILEYFVGLKYFTGIEYSNGEETSWLFIIEKNHIEALKIPFKEAMLKDKVSGLRKKILAQLSCDGDVKWLSETLIPARALERMKNKKRLIVVPHSCLHYLPFSILVDSDGDILAKHFEILTEPSCSVWKLCHDKKKKTQHTLAAYAIGDLGVGAQYIKPLREGETSRGSVLFNPELFRKGFSPLPSTKVEVEDIGKLYKDKVILLSKDMTLEKVRETIKGKSIIHFATHGILDPVNPLFSALLLSDDILETREIFDLDCDPDLVVLSACNTAGGKMNTGDEIEGLSRAFMYQGASAVVASLWSVSDESTAKLMAEFYRELSEGKSKSEALRAAQLKTMEKYPHPFYWAPFIITGD